MFIQSSKKVSTEIGWCYIHYYIRECDSTLYLGLTTLPIVVESLKGKKS